MAIRSLLRPHRSLLWLVVAALLLGSLAPAVSRALAATRSGVGVDVCSSAGSRGAPWYGTAVPTLDMALGAEQRHGGTTPVLDHCPLCLLAAYAIGLIPADRTPTFDAGGTSLSPLPQRLRYVQHDPASPCARGPPDAVSSCV